MWAEILAPRITVIVVRNLFRLQNVIPIYDSNPDASDGEIVAEVQLCNKTNELTFAYLSPKNRSYLHQIYNRKLRFKFAA